MKFFKPNSTAEALRLKKDNPNSYFMAGGTQLNSLFSADLKIEALISLENLSLEEIRKDYVGSCATLEDIRTSPEIHPALAEAASHLASRNVRNMATVGGNVAARQSSSDMLPPLISLNSQVVLEGEDGRREIDIRNWVKDGGGLIVGFKIPGGDVKVFQKKYCRTKNDLPILKLSIGYSLSGQSLESVSVAAGCMAPAPVHLQKTSALLEGTAADSVDAEKIYETASAEVSPIDDQRASRQYRMSLLKSFLEDFASEIREKI